MTARQAATRIGGHGLWLLAALALAGCATVPEGMTPGTMSDPYADLPGGGARYTGTLGQLGAGGVLAGLASPEGFAAAVGDTVQFGDSQVSLSDEARRIVTAQARWLSQNRGFVATLEGHADEQGTREYNLGLGARRAAAVQEYLIASGVEAGRLSTVSYGKERPLGVCTGPDCEGQNRRVLVRVAPGSGV